MGRQERIMGKRNAVQSAGDMSVIARPTKNEKSITALQNVELRTPRWGGKKS